MRLCFALLVRRQRSIDRVGIVVINTVSEDLGGFYRILRVKADSGIGTASNLQLLELQLHLLLRLLLLFCLL